MSGVTVPLGFPYPTDSDLVQGVDEAIQSLAEAADDAIAGTNAAVAAAASVTIPAGNHLFRRGRAVILTINAWILTANKPAGGLLATIPVGYRPVNDVYLTVYNHTGPSFNFGLCDMNGQVLIGNAQGNGSALYAHAVLPL